MSKNPNMARPKVTEKIRYKIMRAKLGTLEEVREFAAKLGLSMSTVYRVRKAGSK